MRSVVVVLPASMCAIMLMFLHRSNGTVLDTAFFLSSFRSSCSLATEPVKSVFLILFALPPVVREGLIGLGHTVNVFLLLDSCAFAVGGVQQLVAQLVNHALLAASASVGNEPANRQRSAAV